MANFTQLNLQGAPQDKSQTQAERNVAPQHRRFSFGTSATIAGSFLVTTLVTLSLLNTEGCSKESKPVAEIARPAAEQTSAMSLPSAPAAIPPAATAKKVVKKPVHHKPAVAKYSNADYGLSFLYPRQFGLMPPDRVDLDWMPMNFVQPGGTTLTVVQLPSGSYPETDLSVAMFNVSVNKNLSESQCKEFAFPEKAKAETDAANSAAASSKNTEPATVKLGKREFAEIENLSGEEKQADTKYYHMYENGACYEFTVGLQTVTGDAAEGTTPVDRSKVFAKLEKIISSVSIKTVEAPAVASAVAGSPEPAANAQTQNTTQATTVVVPEAKSDVVDPTKPQ